jgi:facilitated trehalose transporter
MLSNKAVKLERGKPLRQIVAAFMVNMGLINTGLVFGFAAVALPQLEATD